MDRLKKNKKVGAACGRIHPIGQGEEMILYCCFFPIIVTSVQYCYNDDDDDNGDNTGADKRFNFASLFPFRSNGVVSEVRVRYWSLASEGC